MESFQVIVVVKALNGGIFLWWLALVIDRETIVVSDFFSLRDRVQGAVLADGNKNSSRQFSDARAL